MAFGLLPGLGIDLGTSNILVYVRGRGIVLREPSVVAVTGDGHHILAVGEEARQMLGRTPGNIIATYPLRNGVIADYTITQSMLKYLLDRVCGSRKVFKPQVVVAIPSGATSVEWRAVIEATIASGAKKVHPIEEPLAAAIGAGLPIGSPVGNMIIDLGGGTTDIAVISLGGIVISESLRIGGNEMDEMIARHIKRTYNLMIGQRTAEEIKIDIGSAYPMNPELELAVKGRDLVAGLPKTIQVTSTEIREAVTEPISAMVERVKSVLENTPPELSADIVERGIVLTGGCALLRGLDKLLEAETQVPVHIADDPLSCVVVGTGKYLDYLRNMPKTGLAYTSERSS